MTGIGQVNATNSLMDFCVSEHVCWSSKGQLLNDWLKVRKNNFNFKSKPGRWLLDASREGPLVHAALN